MTNPQGNEPPRAVFIGGPLDGQHREKRGAGRWPSYRGPDGTTVRTEAGDRAMRGARPDLYLIEHAGGAYADRAPTKRDRVYVHASLTRRSTTP